MNRTAIVQDVDGDVRIERHVHPPPPSAISPLNCKERYGIEPKDWPKFLRRIGAAAVTTPTGPVALAVDVEDALRRSSAPLAPKPSSKPKKSPPANDVRDEDDDLARRLGAKAGGAR